MTKLFAWLLAAALVIGLGSVPTLTYAEHHEGASQEAADSDKAPMEEAEEGSDEDSDDSSDDDSSDDE